MDIRYLESLITIVELGFYRPCGKGTKPDTGSRWPTRAGDRKSFQCRIAEPQYT